MGSCPSFCTGSAEVPLWSSVAGSPGDWRERTTVGALPRTPRGFALRPRPLPLPNPLTGTVLAVKGSLRRARRRALDCSGPFRKPCSQEGKGAIGNDRRFGPLGTRLHHNTINQCYPAPPVTF